jgi:restriction endonuclease S subunit
LNFLKKYWQLILAFLAGIFGVLFALRKNKSDVELLNRAQDAEVAVVDAKIENIKEKKQEVLDQKAPIVDDADAKEVNRFWDNKLK